MAPYRARTIYRWMSQKVNWWITQDPTRQWTASRSPCAEDPRTWYGEHA
jgi:hypothetical protein